MCSGDPGAVLFRKLLVCYETVEDVNHVSGRISECITNPHLPLTPTHPLRNEVEGGLATPRN